VDADLSRRSLGEGGRLPPPERRVFSDVDASVFEQADAFGVQAYSKTGVSTVRTGRAFPWIVRWICSTVSGEKNGSPVS